MGYLSSQVNNAELKPTLTSAQFFWYKLKQLDIPLLIEIVLVAFTTIIIIKMFNNNLSMDAWFINPIVLLTAAIIPTIINRRTFPEIGFNLERLRDVVVVLGWTCAIVFPVTLFGSWLLKLYGLNLPFRVVLPKEQNWICWLLYQFLYVAVAEEVFFRGYLQSNILRLAILTKLGQYGLQQWLSTVLSAVCFAAAHVIVQGQIISALTFFPGLILGWLFIRTRTLLAPILFHGLANICYYLIATILT